MDFRMSFVCCDPGLTGYRCEIGGVIAELLSKAGTAENPRESCLCKDVGLALPPVPLQRARMLLCVPSAADPAPSSAGRAHSRINMRPGGCEQQGVS